MEGKLLTFDINEELKKCITIEDLMGKNGLVKRMVKEMTEKLLDDRSVEYAVVELIVDILNVNHLGAESIMGLPVGCKLLRSSEELLVSNDQVIRACRIHTDIGELLAHDRRDVFGATTAGHEILPHAGECILECNRVSDG